MAFSITFLNEPVFYDEGEPVAVGEIVIGEFKETFVATLYEWTKADYEAQWRAAIRTVLDGTKSALIVEYVSPPKGSKLEWWPLYRLKDVVFIQNHLLFYNQLTQPFEPQRLLPFVRDRRTIDEDGRAISEWSVPVSEIKEFAEMTLLEEKR